MQFYFTKPTHKGDFVKGTGEDEQLIGMQGTEEKGPWYNAWPSEFTDRMKDKCIEKGWVVFMGKEVR